LFFIYILKIKVEILNDYGIRKITMFWSKKKGIIELIPLEIKKEILLNNVYREKTNIILSN